MSYRNAAKLHNRDEVILKRTGEVGYVLDVIGSEASDRILIIEAVFPASGYQQVSHREVR